MRAPATGGEHPQMTEQNSTVVEGKLSRDVSRSCLLHTTHTAGSDRWDECELLHHEFSVYSGPLDWSTLQTPHIHTCMHTSNHLISRLLQRNNFVSGYIIHAVLHERS